MKHARNKEVKGFRRIFDWAIGVGMKVSEPRQAGEKPSLPSSLA